jgi:hypothetical protein
MQLLSTLTFDSVSAVIVIAGAVFIHACFQLSVSVLTLLSSHTIGRKLPNSRLLSLNFWYIIGVGISITLLSLAMTALLRYIEANNAALGTLLTVTLLPLIALIIVLFYYRRGRGTRLWLPRPATEFIINRAKKTHSSVEAFSLGTTTVFTELPFIVAPLAISSLVFQGMAAHAWVRASTFYAVLVVLPLIFIALYLSSGHKVSQVQRWREQAKSFLKWTSAITLLALTCYLISLQFGVTT